MQIVDNVDAFLDGLRVRLEKMSESHRVAFAASCAERLYPRFEAQSVFLGNSEHLRLRVAIDMIWGHACGRPLSNAQCSALQTQCAALSIGEESSSILRKGAMEAAGVTWIALDTCKTRAADIAAGAGGCVLNCIDSDLMSMIWELYDRPIGGSDAASVERQVNLHPAMQREIRVQDEIVKYLEGVATVGQHEVATLCDVVRV